MLLSFAGIQMTINFCNIFLAFNFAKEMNDKDTEGDKQAEDNPDVNKLDIGCLWQ